jgi:hypothetical protein
MGSPSLDASSDYMDTTVLAPRPRLLDVTSFGSNW